MTTPQHQFSNTWFVQAATYWPELFRKIGWDAERPAVIVEIGSFEGRSACWILENLVRNPESRLYCIDTFEGSMEHSNAQPRSLYARFLHNIKLTGKEQQVHVRIGRSDQMLMQLIAGDVRADFVYVDGSHQAADVLSDAVLGWKLLRPGGLLVFDDYLWPLYQNQPLLNPKIAIDAFVNCHLDQIRYVHVPQTSQFCLLKAGEEKATA
jgi:predicted O-methyltransferase YrrM